MSRYDVDAVRKTRQKLILITIVGLLLFSTYLLYTSYRQNISLARGEVLQRLHSITKTLAMHFPVQDHQKLMAKYSKKDAITKSDQDPLYAKIHVLMELAHKANRLGTPMYTLVRDEKGFSFGVTSQEKPYFRHRYTTAPKILGEKYLEGAMFGPYGDAHGTWLSAFTPLKNKRGEVVAVLQADQKFGQFIAQARANFLRDFSVTLAVALLLGGLLYLLFARTSTEFLKIFEENNQFARQLSEANEQLQSQNQEIREAMEQKVEALAAEEEAKTQLLSSQKQLVEAEKMASLGRLVAGVAHEINTPLGIGVTAASHLSDKSRAFNKVFRSGKMKKSDLKKFVETNEESTELILANLKRAAELVQSFKQVSVDRTSELKRKFEVNETLSALMASLRPKFREAGHTVEVKYSGAILMDSYPGAFGQVITNLAMNSVVHAYEPGQSGHLLIETELRGDTVHIEYSDDGKGIPEKDFPHIFEPFFTTKRGQGGTGLGLHLTYNLVTMTLQGSIDCESKEGLGTMFLLDLPLKVVDPPTLVDQEVKVSAYDALAKRSSKAEHSFDKTAMIESPLAQLMKADDDEAREKKDLYSSTLHEAKLPAKDTAESPVSGEFEGKDTVDDPVIS